MPHKHHHHNHSTNNSGANHHNHHGHHHHHHQQQNSSQGDRVKNTLGNLLGAALDEVSYQAEKNKLIGNIESLKAQAMLHDARGNYGSAIELYDGALHEAGNLNAIWARHQWHTGNRYGVCTSSSRYTTEINVLKNMVVNKLQLQLQEAQRLRQIEEENIREARRQREVEEARRREEQAALAWQNLRGTIPYAELLKRAADAGIEQAVAILKDLNPMCSTYKNSIPHHIGDDSEVLRKLNAEKNRLDAIIFQEQERVRLLEEAEADNQLQESIHRRIYTVLDALDAYDIPVASELLSQIGASARQFHNIENVQNQMPTPASTFKEPIRELTQLQQEFNSNAKTEALAFAKRITLLVQQDKTSATPGKNYLYSSYELELEATIQKSFQANWKKFNARSAPEDLITSIAEKIAQRLKPIGNKRWMADVLTFTRWPNMSLHDYSALLLEVADSINKYVHLNPPQLQKPCVDAFLQPYTEERMRAATTGQNESNVPMAEYADGTQQLGDSSKGGPKPL